ncbi:GAF domain-containing protein [Calothrix sp. CCY 0018]|uniref:GAF domain-containing protein n=1 Tax=Calothrix sp. CCY 0018 TaxID=3103864 RepID=UPI0039C5FE12
MASHLPRTPAWFNIVIKRKSFLATLLFFAFEGIVANRADDFFVKLIPLFNRPIPIPLWLAVILLLAIILPCTVIIQHYRTAHEISAKLNSLDETLLLLLPKLYTASDADQALRRFFDEFLYQTLEFLQPLDGCGISIYSLDPNDPDYLIAYCQCESPNEKPSKARFYVGQGVNTKRGVAGFTFLDQKSQIVHISRKNGKFYADHPEYIFLEKNDRRRYTYMSLITVPIIGDRNDSLGVLCLYSSSVTAFDSMSVREILIAIAHRLSAAMLIAHKNHIPP